MNLRLLFIYLFVYVFIYFFSLAVTSPLPNPHSVLTLGGNKLVR